MTLCVFHGDNQFHSEFTILFEEFHVLFVSHGFPPGSSHLPGEVVSLNCLRCE